MLADGRRRHPQPASRSSKRSLCHHGGKYRHSIEFIHDYEVLLNQESTNMALISVIVKYYSISNALNPSGLANPFNRVTGDKE
jgi:hypothetical protein